jgi:hypothetical protein
MCGKPGECVRQPYNHWTDLIHLEFWMRSQALKLVA